MNGQRTRTDDPFLLNYNATDLRIASEFLSNWLPFLSRGLCGRCTRTLSDRIRSLKPEFADDVEILNKEERVGILSSNNVDLNEISDNSDSNSLGSWKDGADTNDTADTNGWLDPVGESTSTSGMTGSPSHDESWRAKMSWAEMVQEDELEAEEENESNGHALSGEVIMAAKDRLKPEFSIDRREYIRFNNVRRKNDFICLERVKGRFVNILDGLELHMGVFSAAEQKRIVDLVYLLEEKGKNGELKARTYTAPEKWMRGKGRVTIQFGCCYNYATDKNGNRPGIMRNEIVDPLPHLFKVMIRRLIRWHVLPPSCVPDSCIVNIYDEGDCIPPHIDNHQFVRPFCTVSFLSQCNIIFGTNLEVVGPGEFTGPSEIPLPLGSVLVLSGNGADVAKHCVSAVPTKRISITFRKMDQSKWPIGFVPEPDLQGLQPLSYEDSTPKSLNSSKSKLLVDRQEGRRVPEGRRENRRDQARGSSTEIGNMQSEPRYSTRYQQGSGNRWIGNMQSEPHYSTRYQQGPGNRWIGNMQSEPHYSTRYQQGPGNRWIGNMQSEPHYSTRYQQRPGNRWRFRVNLDR
ncbi:RNA demethylase ALKBH9B-like [Cornus florida]|uniref:RNA demethylase ALKBH9B-like n=1 Tax=Cornus florida TaxID=4283 RepID=UPI00289ED0F1|nr:RNA demethylase ALKBH9B-like [Cornus florida]